MDALGGSDGRNAELARDALHRALGRGGIEPLAAAQEVRGIEQTEHDIGVGDRGGPATAAIAGGPRIGARALRPDVEDAARVHPRDGAAARAEGVDVDGGHRHLLAGHAFVACQLGLAALDQGDVGAGAAHVEGDEIALAEQPRRVAAAGDAAGRARQHGARGQSHRVGDRGHTAMGLHDEHFSGVPGRAEPLSEALQVMPESRAHIRIDHRRAEALVLLDLGQHLGGEGHVSVGQSPAQGLERGLLVARVAIRVQVAYRDGIDAGVFEPLDGRIQRTPVERDLHAAVETHPLAHVEAPRAWHERHRRRHAEVVAIVLEPLAHLDDVAVALGGEHPHRGAFALEERVRGHRRAVDGKVGLAEKPRQIQPELGGQQLEAVHHADRGILGSRSRLGERDAAGLVHSDQVREGSSHINSDAKHQRPFRGRFVTKPFFTSAARADLSRRAGGP